MLARDIVVRTLTSGNRLNRDCLVTEIMRQGEYTTTVTRRCTYHIESHVTVPATVDSIRWAKTLNPHPPRQVHVTKDVDPELGNECVTYKVSGHLYIVLDRDVFCVGYRHVLAMAVTPPAEPTEPCE